MYQFRTAQCIYGYLNKRLKRTTVGAIEVLHEKQFCICFRGSISKQYLYHKNYMI